MIKVAITDDHPMVLTGLEQMLNEHPDISIEGLYKSGAALLQGLKDRLPDVLLLDLQLPDIKGDELAATVIKTYPSVKILVLTSIDVLYRVKQMMKVGCAGYSLKNVSQASLIQAIKTVNKGEEYLDPVIKEELIREMMQFKKPRASSIPDITRREREILDLLSDGCSSKDIAEQLFISVRTVENHRKSLLHKFDVKNTPSLLKRAMELGLR